MSWLFIKECVRLELLTNSVLALSDTLGSYSGRPVYADMQIRLMCYIKIQGKLDLASLQHILTQIMELKRIIATSRSISEDKRTAQMTHIKQVQAQYESMMMELL